MKKVLNSILITSLYAYTTFEIDPGFAKHSVANLYREEFGTTRVLDTFFSSISFHKKHSNWHWHTNQLFVSSRNYVTALGNMHWLL